MAVTFATKFFWSDVTGVSDIQAFVDDLVATNDPSGDAEAKVEVVTIKTASGSYNRYLALTLIDDEVDEPVDSTGLRTLKASGTLDGTEQADIQALIDLAEPTLTDVVGLTPYIVLSVSGLDILWEAYMPTRTQVDTFTDATSLHTALSAANVDGRRAQLVNMSDSSKVICTLQWDATEGGVIPVGKIDVANITQNRFGVISSGSAGAWTLQSGHEVSLGDNFLLWDTSAGSVSAIGTILTVDGDDVTTDATLVTPAAGDIVFVGSDANGDQVSEVLFGSDITAAAGSGVKFWMANNGNEYGLYVEDGIVTLDFAFGTMDPLRINTITASVKAHVGVAGYTATSADLIGGMIDNAGAANPLLFAHRYDSTYLTGHWRTELRRVSSGIGALIAGADGPTVPADSYVHPMVSFMTDDPVTSWRYFVATGGWPASPYGYANAAYTSAILLFTTDFDAIGFAAYDTASAVSVSATFTEYHLQMSID